MLNEEHRKSEDQLHAKGVQFLKEASKEEQLRLLWMMSKSFYQLRVDFEGNGVYVDPLACDEDGFVPVALYGDGSFIFTTDHFVTEYNELSALNQVKNILDEEEE
ncbi:MAG: hypothetical protein CMJ25_10350 [Phycisphaerae bacterium]|nr:hypothetical protein [Phycisphaerae bacterium]|tara:strand:- start:1574 stop:1888 length:315 start_codon:yes stop_codon:yes gene_type:complete